MNNLQEDDYMPMEIDFSKGKRGLHHIPQGARVFLPTSIERGVWEYFSEKAEQEGIGLSILLTDLLRGDMDRLQAGGFAGENPSLSRPETQEFDDTVRSAETLGLVGQQENDIGTLGQRQTGFAAGCVGRRQSRKPMSVQTSTLGHQHWAGQR